MAGKTKRTVVRGEKCLPLSQFSELQLFQNIFKQSQYAMLITDANQNIVAINKTFTRITGYKEKEVLGLTPRVLQSGAQDKAFYKHMWQAISKQGYWQGKLWNRRKGGEIYPEWQTISVLKNYQGVVTHYVAMFFDLTLSPFSNEDLQALRFYDPLTNLPNRDLIRHRLEAALKRAQKKKLQVAFLLIDIDRFSIINSSLGFRAGDLVIRAVAVRLQELLGPSMILGHLGGDRFVIIMTDLKERLSAQGLAQKIINHMRKSFQLLKRKFYLTVSIGITLFPNSAKTVSEMFTRAEITVQKVKDNSRNNYQFYSSGVESRYKGGVLALEKRLFDALKKEQFLLDYQPIVSMNTGKLLGAEALIRWKVPGLGLIPPNDFIPLAHENGLIGPIGKWVLQTACEQLATWKKQYGADIFISVNVDVAQLSQSDFLKEISQILKRTRVSPQDLILEITENALVSDELYNIELLNRVKKIGVKIAIDDFGTGYSSLAYLRRFSIDKLKIDTSFVKHLFIELDAPTLTSAIIALAKSLRLSVTAEGVETRDQLIILRAQQCDELQGNYYSRPVSAKKFESFIKNDKHLKF